MFGFLGFILIFFLLILLISFAIIGNIIRRLLGFGKRKKKQKQKQSRTYTYQQTYHWSANDPSNVYTHSNESTSSQADPIPSGEKKKIFDDDEGEYVDFEEVKEK